MSAMNYYNLIKNWRKVVPHLKNPEFNQILIRDFNRYAMGYFGTPFVPGMTPEDLQNVQIHYLRDFYSINRDPRVTKRGEYWKYVKQGSCHWSANFELKLAQLVEPGRPWRIVTSGEHSTVWDGANTLFEFAYQAIGVTPKKCWELASSARHNSEKLEPGKELEVFLGSPEFYPVMPFNDDEVNDSLDVLVREAKRYNLNLVNSLKLGALATDYDSLMQAIVRYNNVNSFIQQKDAEALKRIVESGNEEFATDIDRCIKTTRPKAQRLFKQINREGNVITFFSHNSMENQREEGMFSIERGKLVNHARPTGKTPKDALIHALHVSLAFRWDAMMIVERKNEPIRSWKFGEFNATESRPGAVKRAAEEVAA